jgi:hypothetical protein
MGYDLSLAIANDEQIEFLSVHPEHTRDFLDARRPTRSVVEATTSWFRKRETTRTEVVEINCEWPEAPLRSVQLYLRDGLYFLLNGTHENLEVVTNFPNVGGRYRKEMLGKAYELGEVGLGRAHAFKSSEALQLQEAVAAVEKSVLESRVRSIAAEMELEDAASEAERDLASLKEIIGLAVARKCGLIWFWA